MHATLSSTRRSRSRPTTTGTRITPTSRDVEIALKLYEHGPLPTAYLYEFTKHMGRDLTRLKKRVGDLFHEDQTPHGGAYLARPWQLNPEADYSHFVVSENTPAALNLLAAFGKLNPEAKASAGGSYAHMFMAACITASFELAVRQRRDLRFISRGEIMANALTKTLAIPAPISYLFKNGMKRYDRPIIPDAMFGIEYIGVGKLYFLIEADLNNEPLKRQDFETTSYLRKVLQYKEAIGAGRYKAAFGFEQGLVVLTFTTNVTHADHIRAMVLDVLGPTRYLLFAALPQFEGPFSVPGVITDILDRPYQRAGRDDFHLGSFA